MTFDTHGRTMMGLDARGRDGAACAVWRSAPRRSAPIAASGPRSWSRACSGWRARPTPDDLIVAKGNCGIPQYRDGHIHYDGTPAVMADYACLARDAGARIIGGCCGTTPAHLAAMALALAERAPGPPPDRATIEAPLGPLPDGAGARCRGRARAPRPPPPRLSQRVTHFGKRAARAR